MGYDPWPKITTRNGYAGDEVISALQKSIRRGLEEQACMFVYELYISSPQLEVDNDYKARYGKILEEYDSENAFN